jgi:hypothetical protein
MNSLGGNSLGIRTGIDNNNNSINNNGKDLFGTKK